MDAPLSPRQEYIDWVEEQIEDYKCALTREELLALADDAITGLFHTDDGQYPLTEILLKDTVDALVFRRLRLPTYRQWLRACQSDTPACPHERTNPSAPEGRQAS